MSAAPEIPARTPAPGTATRAEPACPSGLGSLGYQLNLVARMARANFERRLAEAGASFATWTVLELLAGRGPMVQGQLADALNVRGPTLTRLLDRLTTAGLVRKLPIAEDRRKAQVTLTPAGTELHANLAAAAKAANAQLIAGFSPDEVAQLRHLLDRIAGNLAAPRT